jgi:hypothetical protein
MNADTDRHVAELEAFRAIVEAAKTEILAKMPKPEPLGWKLLTLILPIILTSILGIFVFKMQSSINSRLTLTQDYYRKRLEVYGKLYDNLVSVRERAQRALNEPITSAGLDDTVEAFNRSYSGNTIFLTQPLIIASENMWKASVRAIAEPSISPESLATIRKGADAVERQMRLDLVGD